MSNGAAGDPRETVKLPAIFLIVNSSLGVLMSVLGLIYNLLIGGAMAMQGGSEEQAAVGAITGVVGLVFGLLGIGIYGFAIFGAIKFKNLQSKTLAMVSAIVNMLPCSMCCLTGIGVGI